MCKKILIALLCCLAPLVLIAQKIDAAYAKALHKKYPSVKTDFCSSCKLWVNPYYKSIADTAKHMPLLTFYVYTKGMRLEEERLALKRSGTVAAWFPSVGQPKEDDLYTQTNKAIGMPYQPQEIQKGHCQAWILLAHHIDAAILSNTYTFNSAMEYRGQNLGTEIESEELCRKLVGWKGNEVTDRIAVWCGTFGSQQTYSYKKLTATVPSYYYKILKYFDKIKQKNIIRCFWFPNQKEETADKMDSREISYASLKSKLGFDPMVVFKDLN